MERPRAGTPERPERANQDGLKGQFDSHGWLKRIAELWNKLWHILHGNGAQPEFFDLGGEAAEDVSLLALGTQVSIAGLTSARGSPLNGLSGTVVSYVEASQRYGIHVPVTGDEVLLKRDNLQTSPVEEHWLTDYDISNDAGTPQAVVHRERMLLRSHGIDYRANEWSDIYEAFLDRRRALVVRWGFLVWACLEEASRIVIACPRGVGIRFSPSLDSLRQQMARSSGFLTFGGGVTWTEKRSLQLSAEDRRAAAEYASAQVAHEEADDQAVAEAATASPAEDQQDAAEYAFSRLAPAEALDQAVAEVAMAMPPAEAPLSRKQRRRRARAAGDRGN
jgi:hypothetical protein